MTGRCALRGAMTGMNEQGRLLDRLKVKGLLTGRAAIIGERDKRARACPSRPFRDILEDARTDPPHGVTTVRSPGPEYQVVGDGSCEGR